MSESRCAPRLAVALTAACLGVAPLAADRVVLVNGRVFEDVSAEVRAEGVTIAVGGGALTLARDQVASIESGPSTLAEYRLRAEALRRKATARAADWLDLARWARARACDFGAREAALTAAALDPELAGLGGLLRNLGYEQADPGGAWLPFEDAMRRRGWVEEGGEWVSAAVAEARETARREQREERRRAAEAARLDRLAALTEARLAADLAQPQPPYATDYGGWGYPAWGYPVWVPRPGHGGGPDRPPAPSPSPLPARPPQSQPTTNSILSGQAGVPVPVQRPR